MGAYLDQAANAMPHVRTASSSKCGVGRQVAAPATSGAAQRVRAAWWLHRLRGSVVPNLASIQLQGQAGRAEQYAYGQHNSSGSSTALTLGLQAQEEIGSARFTNNWKCLC
jgi:hypothetical protein